MIHKIYAAVVPAVLDIDRNGISDYVDIPSNRPDGDTKFS